MFFVILLHKIGIITYKIGQGRFRILTYIEYTPKNCLTLLRFCQNAKYAPNLVTLKTRHLGSKFFVNLLMKASLPS